MSPESIGPQPDDGLDELRLAVALDAGDRDDLAGPDVERTPLTAIWKRSSRMWTSFSAQDDLAGLRRRLVDDAGPRRGRP